MDLLEGGRKLSYSNNSNAMANIMVAPINIVDWSALLPFLLNLTLRTFQVRLYLKRSIYVLTLDINVHHCKVHSTRVVCSAPVFSILSSVDVSDVQWVSVDVLTSRDFCPQYSWITNTCSHITVHFHIVTFFDNFIFGLLHRCQDCQIQSNVQYQLYMFLAWHDIHLGRCFNVRRKIDSRLTLQWLSCFMLIKKMIIW